MSHVFSEIDTFKETPPTKCFSCVRSAVAIFEFIQTPVWSLLRRPKSECVFSHQSWGFFTHFFNHFTIPHFLQCPNNMNMRCFGMSHRSPASVSFFFSFLKSLFPLFITLDNFCWSTSKFMGSFLCPLPIQWIFLFQILYFLALKCPFGSFFLKM